MTDTTPEPPALTTDELRRRRTERQRQQRMLMLEEQIAGAKVRVTQARNRLDGAAQHLASLEAELAELQAAAPPEAAP